jgi:hypothetical protein
VSAILSIDLLTLWQMGRCEERVEVTAVDADLVTANASPNVSGRIDEGRAFGFSTINLVPYLIVRKRSVFGTSHSVTGFWFGSTDNLCR